jgi:hypothetical protein
VAALELAENPAERSDGPSDAPDVEGRQQAIGHRPEDTERRDDR